MFPGRYYKYFLLCNREIRFQKHIHVKRKQVGFDIFLAFLYSLRLRRIEFRVTWLRYGRYSRLKRGNFLLFKPSPLSVIILQNCIRQKG